MCWNKDWAKVSMGQALSQSRHCSQHVNVSNCIFFVPTVALDETIQHIELHLIDCCRASDAPTCCIAESKEITKVDRVFKINPLIWRTTTFHWEQNSQLTKQMTTIVKIHW